MREALSISKASTLQGRGFARFEPSGASLRDLLLHRLRDASGHRDDPDQSRQRRASCDRERQVAKAVLTKHPQRREGHALAEGHPSRTERQQAAPYVGSPRLPTLASEQIEGVGMAKTELVQVTYREIAERFGIGIEGARIKAKRRAAKGEWRLIPGNHPQDIVRVEMPADEFRAGTHKSPRTPPYEPADGLPTAAPLQDLKRRDTNDLEALVEIVSQLTAQSQSMTERLIEAERMRAEAQRDTAIAQTEWKVIQERMTVLQEQHLSELMALRDQITTETERRNKAVIEAEVRESELQDRVSEAEASLAALHARPWWRRLAG